MSKKALHENSKDAKKLEYLYTKILLIYKQIKQLVKKKAKVVISLTSLSLFLALFSLFRSETGSITNERMHHQTQEIVDTGKKQILDSLTELTRAQEEELKFYGEIKKMEIKSQLGKYKYQIDSLFAIALQEKYNIDESINLYSEIINLTPYCYEAYYNRALLYRTKRLYKAALEDYNAAKTLNPNDPDLYTGRGIVYCLQKQYGEALSDFENALRLDSTKSQNYLNFACLFREQKEYSRAISYSNKALELAPDDIDILAMLSDIYLECRYFKKALEINKRIIKIAPNSYFAHRHQGYILFSMKNYTSAIKEYSLAIQLFDGIDNKILSTLYHDRAVVYLNYGTLSTFSDYSSLALSDLDSAIALDAKNAVAYANRGNIYNLESNFEQAISDYMQAYEIEPNEDYFLKLLLCYRKLHGDNKLLLFCDEQLKKHTENSTLYFWKSYIAFENNDYEKALNLVEKAIAIYPENEEYNDLKINCYIKVNRLQEAIEAIDFVLQFKNLNPIYCARFYLSKSKVLFAINPKSNINMVLQYCNAAIELDSQNFENFYFRARIENNRENFLKAIDDLSQAIALYPHSQIYEDRANCYLTIGEKIKAQEDFEKAEFYKANPPKFRPSFIQKNFSLIILEGKVYGKIK